jgi:hypothetical protein
LFKAASSQAFEPYDQQCWKELALNMLRWVDGDNSLLDIFFSEKSAFHLSGMVNESSSTIWDSANPHVVCMDTITPS